MTPDNLINFTREIEQVRSFIEYIKQTNKIADTNFSDLDIETEEEQIYIDILMSNFQEYHRYLSK